MLKNELYKKKNEIQKQFWEAIKKIVDKKLLVFPKDSSPAKKGRPLGAKNKPKKVKNDKANISARV